MEESFLTLVLIGLILKGDIDIDIILIVYFLIN